MPNDEFTSPFSRFVNRSARGLQDFTINTLQSLPEPIKNPIRQTVGRVATNVISSPTYGEHQEAIDAFRPQNIISTLGNIIKDRPAVPQNDFRMSANRPLFREYFNLPPQDTNNVFLKQGKDYRINPNTTDPQGQATLHQFQFPDAEGTYSRGSPDIPTRARNNSISGDYIPGQPDPYDFNLHSNEMPAKGMPYSFEGFARTALGAIGKPAVLQTGGYYNPSIKDKSYFPAVNDFYRQ